MKIGLYSITYRGVWYQGDAIDVVGLVRLAREFGFALVLTALTVDPSPAIGSYCSAHVCSA